MVDAPPLMPNRPFVTFLFTDIEGSVRLMEAQPHAMPQALAQHDAIARDCVARHAGRVVKHTGDGLHAVFDDTLGAVQAALALQLALADPAATHGLPLRIRCGLHGGHDEARDGDYFGPAVNRAARIMGIAHGGQTLLSDAVAERVLPHLPGELALADLGRVRLRDLGSPERVHQLQHARLRSEFPPLRSLEATPNNLAQQLDSFVGRERELAAVRALLGRNRLVTLLGTGGLGKSRLSVQLGAEVLDQFADGVWLVEFAALTDPRLVPQAVANVLGLAEAAGVAITDTLLQHVRTRQLLIILDNCEHLVHACAELAKQLLQAGAGLKLLASSRTVLQLAGEATYQVPTLGVPEPSDQAPDAAGAEALARHAAVRLFADRAMAANPSFAITPANMAAVADICRRLDGIPLALELAAARTRALSAEAISARLGDRFKLLVTNDQTVLPRQRTLRALIDWSHDLLDERERRLFRRLAVFAGGWTLEAAEAVSAGPGLEAADVLDLQTSLVEKSLAVMEPGGARYRMLDTVRHYALDQLAQAGEAPALGLQHLVHCVGAAEVARPHLAGPEQGRWLARLDLERENFLSAHAFGAQSAAADTATTDDLAVRLIHALRPYWIQRGNLSIGLRQSLEVLARPGLAHRDMRRCMALFAAGQFTLFMGRHDEAHAYLDETLQLARELGNDFVVLRVLQPLATACWERGDLALAQTCLQQAVELARAQGDLAELTSALNSLGMLHRMRAEWAEAVPPLTQAVALARELGAKRSLGIASLNLAMTRISSAELAPARSLMIEVLDLAEETASLLLEHNVLEASAGLAAALLDWPRAAEFYGHARAQRQQSGIRRDAVDEAFISPRIERVRAALGDPAYERASAIGAQRPRHDVLPALRRWLREDIPFTSCR